MRFGISDEGSDIVGVENSVRKYLGRCKSELALDVSHGHTLGKSHGNSTIADEDSEICSR